MAATLLRLGSLPRLTAQAFAAEKALVPALGKARTRKEWDGVPFSAGEDKVAHTHIERARRTPTPVRILDSLVQVLRRGEAPFSQRMVRGAWAEALLCEAGPVVMRRLGLPEATSWDLAHRMIQEFEGAGIYTTAPRPPWLLLYLRALEQHLAPGGEAKEARRYAAEALRVARRTSQAPSVVGTLKEFEKLIASGGAPEPVLVPAAGRARSLADMGDWPSRKAPLTVDEAMRVLDLGREAVLRQCRDGKLPARKHGRNWLIDPVGLAALLGASPRAPLRGTAPASRSPDPPRSMGRASRSESGPAPGSSGPSGQPRLESALRLLREKTRKRGGGRGGGASRTPPS